MKEQKECYESSHVLKQICDSQGELFQYVNHQYRNLKQFIPQFFNTDFCKFSLDGPYSYYQLSDAEELLPEIEKEITLRASLNDGEDDYLAYWMGYMYRYVARKYSIPSIKLYQMIDYDTLLHILWEYDQDGSVEDIEQAILDKIKC